MTTRALLYWISLVAGAELMVRGHLADRAGLFHAGAWLLVAALAVTAWRWRRTRGVAAACAALALLPAALSLLAVARPQAAAPEDPLAAFWREHAADRAQLLEPLGADREDAQVRVFGEPITLDARGSRAEGAASAPEPGSFRIVALGGANTFGATLGPDEDPWPALLQRAIDAQLRCAASVRVVNAGVVGGRFAELFGSIEDEVFALEPDVVVVYPTPHELLLLAREVPELAVPVAEPVPPRVSQPLRQLERWLRERALRAPFEAARAVDPSRIDVRPLSLAGAYRRLMVEARERGTDVVLAPLALALSADAPEREIRRHEAVEPRTRQLLVASALHTRLLAGIGATYRAAWADLEAGPRAGDDAAFLDLWLLSQRGREQLADAVLRALGARLAAQPQPGCTPRSQSASRSGGK